MQAKASEAPAYGSRAGVTVDRECSAQRRGRIGAGAVVLDRARRWVQRAGGRGRAAQAAGSLGKQQPWLLVHVPVAAQHMQRLLGQRTPAVRRRRLNSGSATVQEAMHRPLLRPAPI